MSPQKRIENELRSTFFEPISLSASVHSLRTAYFEPIGLSTSIQRPQQPDSELQSRLAQGSLRSRTRRLNKRREPTRRDSSSSEENDRPLIRHSTRRREEIMIRRRDNMLLRGEFVLRRGERAKSLQQARQQFHQDRNDRKLFGGNNESDSKHSIMPNLRPGQEHCSREQQEYDLPSTTGSKAKAGKRKEIESQQQNLERHQQLLGLQQLKIKLEERLELLLCGGHMHSPSLQEELLRKDLEAVCQLLQLLAATRDRGRRKQDELLSGFQRIMNQLIEPFETTSIPLRKATDSDPELHENQAEKRKNLEIEQESSPIELESAPAISAWLSGNISPMRNTVIEATALDPPTGCISSEVFELAAFDPQEPMQHVSSMSVHEQRVLLRAPLKLLKSVSICALYYLAYLCTAIFSLALCLWWSFAKEDVNGGFTMGAYVVALGTAVTMPLHGRHSKTCQCR